MKDLIRIITTQLKPLSIEESGKDRTVSVTDQKLFLCAVLAIDSVNSTRFLTKREFSRLTQISERSVTRLSKVLSESGLINVEKNGSKFRLTVLISAVSRIQNNLND